MFSISVLWARSDAVASALPMLGKDKGKRCTGSKAVVKAPPEHVNY